MTLTDDDAAMLANIGFHWDTCYEISFNGEVYSAARTGYPGHIVTAETAGELRLAIRSDYFAWLATLKERMSV